MKFSEAFHLAHDQISLDFINIPLDTDLRFFIDPTVIRALKTSWGKNLGTLIQDYFQDVIVSIKENDLKRASYLLSSLRETNAFHLGYSIGKSSGKALGEKTAEDMLTSLKNSQAAQTGLLKDLEDTALTIQGIASDRISDSVCNILKISFIEYTQHICKFYGVELSECGNVRLWDDKNNRWVKKKIMLPRFDDEAIIVIPKALARERITYSHSGFYRKYIIPEIRNEHINIGSALVSLLKGGKPRVTTKRIIEEYGQSKEFIESQLVKYPNAIREYREEVLLNTPPPLEHKDFEPVKGIIDTTLFECFNKIHSLPVSGDSSIYVDNVKKILSIILYPSLFYPIVINDSFNDYRFTMLNESRSGFFFDFSIFNIFSERVLFCIKNEQLTKDDNYLESIFYDMKEKHTQVCLIICRKGTEIGIEEGIRKIAKENNKYIFILDDDVIKKLIDEYLIIGMQQFEVLRNLFKKYN